MAEAVITELEVPTYFLRVIGYSKLGVQSRAVAGVVDGYSTGCVWVLDEDDRASLVAKGTVNFDSDCEVMVNSDHDRAITVNGGACMEATYVGTVGDYVNNGQANAGCMGSEEQWLATGLPDPEYFDGAGATTSDPLLQFVPTVPDVTVAPIATDVQVSDGDPPYYFTPGRYYGSTTPIYDPLDPTLIVGYGSSVAISITGGQAYFAPGLYIIDSGLRINGGVTRISTNGVDVSLAEGDPGVSFYFTGWVFT